MPRAWRALGDPRRFYPAASQQKRLRGQGTVALSLPGPGTLTAQWAAPGPRSFSGKFRSETSAALRPSAASHPAPGAGEAACPAEGRGSGRAGAHEQPGCAICLGRPEPAPERTAGCDGLASWTPWGREGEGRGGGDLATGGTANGRPNQGRVWS